MRKRKFVDLCNGWITCQVSAGSPGPLLWVRCCCAGLQGSDQQLFAPLSALSSLDLCLRPLSSNSPRGWRKSTPSLSNPIALDSPFLSASRSGMSIAHLCLTTQQNKERAEGVGRKVYCVSAGLCRTQNNWKSVSDEGRYAIISGVQWTHTNAKQILQILIFKYFLSFPRDLFGFHHVCLSKNWGVI